MSDHPLMREFRDLYRRIYGKDMPVQAPPTGRCPRCQKPWDDHKNGACPR